jgi:hypothetical protein
VVRDHRVSPPGDSVGNMPIREYSVAWPHRSDVLATVGVVQEYSTIVTISVDAIVIACVIGVRDVDCRVNNAGKVLVELNINPPVLRLRNVMLVVRSKLFEEVLASFNSKGVGVVCEVAVLEHVIDVVPNRLKRDAHLSVPVDHLFRFSPVLVALYCWSAYAYSIIRAVIAERPHERDSNLVPTYPTTLVEAKPPVGLHGR